MAGLEVGWGFECGEMTSDFDVREVVIIKAGQGQPNGGSSVMGNEWETNCVSLKW